MIQERLTTLFLRDVLREKDICHKISPVFRFSVINTLTDPTNKPPQYRPQRIVAKGSKKMERLQESYGNAGLMNRYQHLPRGFSLDPREWCFSAPQTSSIQHPCGRSRYELA